MLTRQRSCLSCDRQRVLGVLYHHPKTRTAHHQLHSSPPAQHQTPRTRANNTRRRQIRSWLRVVLQRLPTRKLLVTAWHLAAALPAGSAWQRCTAPARFSSRLQKSCAHGPQWVSGRMLSSMSLHIENVHEFNEAALMGCRQFGVGRRMLLVYTTTRMMC